MRKVKPFNEALQTFIISILTGSANAELVTRTHSAITAKLYFDHFFTGDTVIEFIL
jgi:hypothetical protein